MTFDVHTLRGDPDCSICDGTGEMATVTYGRPPTRGDTECCVCVEPYRDAHTCLGCGDGVAPGAVCPCWAEARMDTLGHALSGAAAAAMAMRSAA